MVRSTPMGLTVLRLLLAPVLVWLVYANVRGTAFAAVIFIAVTEPFVGITVILGLVAQVEGLFISVVLPAWTHDVPTVVQALRIRETYLGNAASGKQRPS
jgi:hypothetical protein